MVSSGQKLVITGAVTAFAPDQTERVFEESKGSFSFIQELIRREGLDADYQPCGRFFGAWAPGHSRPSSAMPSCCAGTPRSTPPPCPGPSSDARSAPTSITAAWS